MFRRLLRKCLGSGDPPGLQNRRSLFTGDGVFDSHALPPHRLCNTLPDTSSQPFDGFDSPLGVPVRAIWFFFLKLMRRDACSWLAVPVKFVIAKVGFTGLPVCRHIDEVWDRENGGDVNLVDVLHVRVV